MTLRFDHLAISAVTLAEGIAWVEDRLGVALAGGGQHPHMGTHNRLLGLGDAYLEVIAIDPETPRPAWPRWFDLDRFEGPPRLTNWIAQSDDLVGDLALCPPGTGVPVALSRGDLRWTMAVPGDGCLPFEGAFPALIAWVGTAHPSQRLPEMGVRLDLLEIAHPAAPALRRALAGVMTDSLVALIDGPQKAMRARFSTPHGPRWIE